MLAIQSIATDLYFMLPPESLTQAENAHRRGEYEEAEKAYRAVLAKGQNIDALFGLATLFHHTKRYAKANKLFTQALGYEPNAFDINFNALLCLIDSNETEAARRKFRFILTIAPQQTDIAEQLAALALKLDLPEQVLSILSYLNPLSLQAKRTQLQAMMKLDMPVEAHVLSRSLIAAQPNDRQLLSLHAICQVKMQLNLDAIDTYKHLVSLDPNNSALRIKFADLFLVVHESKLAREQLDIAIGLNDESLTRLEVECKICRIEGHKNEALIAADKALQIKPEAEFAWHVKQDLGDAEQNRICVKELRTLTASPQDYSYDLQHNLYTLAAAHQKLAEYTQAFENYHRANELQSEQFLMAGKQYSATKIEEEFEILRGLPYPVRPIADYDDKQCQNIFIVGMPRTGTTLTNRVLSQHEGIESCGESNAVPILFENLLLNSGLSKSGIASKLSDPAADFVTSYRKINNSELPLVVDKMPHNFRYVGAILAAFPNCRIIQMRRELGDLALSIYSNFFNQQHSYACDLRNIAHHTYQANKMMDHWAASFPGQVIDLHYDQLVVEPKTGFQHLFDFCNLEWNDDYLSFHKQVVSSFTFSETQVRRPINTSKLGFSKHYEQQLQIVYDTHTQLSAQN